MALKGRGRILPHKRGGLYIYISKDVANDSSFPFKSSENVNVKIDKNKVILERSKLK